MMNGWRNDLLSGQMLVRQNHYLKVITNHELLLILGIMI